MSFGWDPWDHAIIDPAIQEAFDMGVVMCVATHNDDSSIRYPATNPLVMACGASDQIDNRKSPISPDGERWGSNYGPEISVVAPGVLIPSTDRLGNNGYTNGDYMPDFNGTSAATPHLAGLAALLLSCDSSLTNLEVRNIIEQTADKVGNVPYAVTVGKPNGAWNMEMGYGRINAYRALSAVCKRPLFDVLDRRRPFEEVPEKLQRFKEKERLEEVKGLIGYENPLVFDPTIYERILEQLDRIEQQITRGQPFISRAERPDVGGETTRRARRKRGQADV